MTYAQFDHAMMYVWFVYVPVLFAFVVWAAWVLLWDEPRKRRRLAREAQDIPDTTPKP